MVTPVLPPVSFELPSDDVVLPTITPHQIALCFLVKGYLSPGEHDPGGSWPQRQALGDALLTAIREASTLREPNIEELAVRLRTDVTNNLVDTSFQDRGEYGGLVVTSLATHMRAEGILDRVVVLFTHLASMVTTSTNSRAEDSVGADDNSVMGFFLRRAWCDFTALSFEDTCVLAAACERYAEGAATGMLRPRAGMERALAATVVAAECATPAARAQLEGPLGEVLEATQGALPEAHRTALALAVLRRDVRAAVWEAHEQFDAPHHPYLPLIGSIAAGEAPPADRHRQRLQAAALQAAAAAVRLRRLPAACLALGEAIRAAHVARDDACLQHILAQICCLLETSTPGTCPLFMVRPPPPPGTPRAHLHAEELRQSLEKLLARAEDLGLPHLGAYARLGLARQALLHPRRYDPAAELGHPGGEARVPQEIPGRPGEHFRLYPSRCAAAAEVGAAVRYVRHLAMAAAAAAAVPAPPASNSGLACLRILKGLNELFIPLPKTFGPAVMGAQAAAAAEAARLAGGACLLRASGWALHGARRLALGHIMAFLQGQNRRASFEDRAAAFAQAAVAVADDAGFVAADRFLANVATRYPDASSSRAMDGARLVLAHRRACHRGEARAAKAAAARFIGLAEPPSDDPRDPVPSGIHYKLLGEEMIAQAYFAEGDLSAAEAAARGVAWPLAMRYYQAHSHLRLLCLLGRIALAAGDAETAAAYAAALYGQAKEQHVDLLVAEAVLLRCGAWLREGRDTGHLDRALAELDAAFPLIMAHGGLDLKARARLLLANCLVESAPWEDAVSAVAVPVIRLLHEARRDFRALEAADSLRECFALEAKVRTANASPFEAASCSRHAGYLARCGTHAMGPADAYDPPYHWPNEWCEAAEAATAAAAMAAAPTDEDRERAARLRRRFEAIVRAKKQMGEEASKAAAADKAAAGAPAPAPSTSAVPMME